MIVKTPARSGEPPGHTLKIAKGYGKAIMLEWARFSADRSAGRVEALSDLVDQIFSEAPPSPTLASGLQTLTVLLQG
jgi:hypothetical protein